MNINCINKKIATSNGVLQTILKAILALYNDGNKVMSHKVVRQKCYLIDTNFPKNGYNSAISNAMKNSIQCGGRMLNEYSVKNDFTIAFDENTTNLDIKISKKSTLKVPEQTNIQKLSIDSNFKNEHFYIPSRLGAKTLIIINCSSSKCEGGQEKKSIKDFFDKDITPYHNFIKRRNEIISQYSDNIKNPRIVKEAYLRYNGGGKSWVYNNVDWNKVIDLHKKNKLEVIILSALYGVVEFNLQIPEYDLTIDKTQKQWGNTINDVIEEYIKNKEIINVFNCISSGYSPLIKNIKATQLSQGFNQTKLALWINSIIDALE
jgi:hypothetical protein